MHLPLHIAKKIGHLVRSDVASIWRQRLSKTHWSMFFAEHQEAHGAYVYVTHDSFVLQEGSTELSMKLRFHGQGLILRGTGKDVSSAIIDALGLRFEVRCCSTCADTLRAGNVAFVEISMPNGETACGLGDHENVVAAQIKAILNAVNHALNQGVLKDEMLVAASPG
ncbi:hypothetical protein [Steroidobacter cummioxidans]|uniref:hypothetical protein n=1 Tax=Steroidobacter cummioxidans TaxID=1803913 RepID=UPI0019D45748|nr:hypothetical protein [Steroidobacter cummioxidans]